MDSAPPPLCGETWFSLLRRSSLALQCGQQAPRYARVKPWYLLATEAIAATLNQLSTPSLLLAWDALERSCARRDQLAVSMTDTVFTQFYDTLHTLNGDANHTRLCSEIALLVDPDKGFLPDYVAYSREWYFAEIFRFYVPYYHGDMKGGAVAIVALLSAIVLTSLAVLLLIPLYKCLVCMRSRLQPQPYEALFSYHDEI
jgi:hypothetical protein